MANNTLIFEWIDHTHLPSFYHKFHKRHGAAFADQLDNGAIWLTQEKISGGMSELQVKDILIKALEARRVKGKSYRLWRYPGSNEEIGKDTLDFLIPLMRSVGMGYWADNLVRIYGDTRLPHRKDHLLNRSTFWGRVFECADSVVDWFSNSQPSRMNNIARLLWASYNGRKNHTAVSLFKKKLDPWYIVVVYGHKRPEDGAGKKGKELKRIYDAIYKKAMDMPISVNDPPPIFLGYSSILDTYL